MANYTVSAEDWTDLATLMDDDYDASDNYTLCVNQIPLGLLQVAYESSKPTGKGKELPSFSTELILAGSGSTVWLKASSTPIDVYIYETPSAS